MSTWFGWVLVTILVIVLLAAGIVLGVDVAYMMSHKRKPKKKGVSK